MWLSERVLAIGLMGAMTMLGLDVYSSNMHAADLNKTKDRIDNMFVSLDAFYSRHCGDVAKPTVTTTALVSGGLVVADDTNTPFGDALVPSIDWLTTPVHLTISTTVDNALLDDFKRLLKPSSYLGNTLSWSRHPDISVSQNETDLFKAMYEPGCF